MTVWLVGLGIAILLSGGAIGYLWHRYRKLRYATAYAFEQVSSALALLSSAKAGAVPAPSTLPPNKVDLDALASRAEVQRDAIKAGWSVTQLGDDGPVVLCITVPIPAHPLTPPQKPSHQIVVIQPR